MFSGLQIPHFFPEKNYTIIMFLFKFDLGHTFEHKDGLHTIIQKCEK